jgi:hypothetical protein
VPDLLRVQVREKTKMKKAITVEVWQTNQGTIDTVVAGGTAARVNRDMTGWKFLGTKTLVIDHPLSTPLRQWWIAPNPIGGVDGESFDPKDHIACVKKPANKDFIHVVEVTSKSRVLTEDDLLRAMNACGPSSFDNVGNALFKKFLGHLGFEVKQ